MEQNLDYLLGVGGGNTQQFQVVKVDNHNETITQEGKEYSVRNQEGGYYTSEKLEDGEYEDKKYAKVFSGTILLVRASLQEKWKQGEENKNKWYTKEFNQLDKTEIIQVRKGKEILMQDTYQKIKDAQSIFDSNGERRNNFDYILNVYVLVSDEIIKVKLKGPGRANFFDYNLVYRTVETMFATEYVTEGVENPYHMATFKSGVEVDKDEMDIKAYELLKQLGIDTTPKLEQPKVEQIEQPQQPAVPQPQQPQPNEQTLPPAQPMAKIDEEVKVENILF